MPRTLDEFTKSPHKEEFGELLEASAEAELTLEETKAVIKVAKLVEFNIALMKRLKDAGKLTKAEVEA